MTEPEDQMNNGDNQKDTAVKSNRKKLITVVVFIGFTLLFLAVKFVLKRLNYTIELPHRFHIRLPVFLLISAAAGLILSCRKEWQENKYVDTARWFFSVLVLAILIIPQYAPKYEFVDGVVYTNCITKPKKVNRSFKKVDWFSYPVKLLTCEGFSWDGNDYQMRIKLYGQKSEGQIPRRYTSINTIDIGKSSWTFVVRADDRKEFYLFREDSLKVFNDKFELLREIPNADFQIYPDKSISFFTDYAYYENGKLFFVIKRVLKSEDRYQAWFYPVMWNVQKQPNECIWMDEDILSINHFCVIPDSNIIYTTSTAMRYDTSRTDSRRILFDQRKIEELRSISLWEIIDYCPEYGFLLSSQYRTDRPTEDIIHYTLAGEKKAVTQGQCAVWGYDGMVYFGGFGGQLWQCDNNGDNRKLMCNVNLDPTGYKISYPPVVSSDKRFLAHNFSGSPKVFGTILFDLKAKEYAIIPGFDPPPGHMIWITPSPDNPMQ